MQILITGSEGFIGKNLKERLLRQNFNVIGVDIIGKNSIMCNLNKPSSIKSLFQNHSPEIIIHLAAISSSTRSYKQSILTQKLNFMGTVNLLEIAYELDPKLEYFVFASSSEVYGGLTPKTYCETDLPQPLSPYASSKLSAESFINMKGVKDQLDTCCVRFCNTYGRTNVTTYLVEYLFQCFLSKKSPYLKTPESAREFLYLPDHLKVYDYILKKRPIGILNASSGESSSILEIASKIQRITASNIPIEKKEDSKKTEIILDTKKLKGLGYTTDFTIESGLLDFYKSIKNKKDFIKAI